MDVNKIANLSPSEMLAKCYQAPVKEESEQKQQAQLVSSKASQASIAYATPQISNSKNINFEGKYEKLAEKIKTSTNPSKIQLNFDEVCNLLDHMGYKIESAKGSHYTVDIPGKRPLTIARHAEVNPGTKKDIWQLLNNKYTGL